MNHVVKRQLVGFARKQKVCKDALLQLSVRRIDVLTDQLTKLLLQLFGRAHESFGSGVAVVHADATALQYVADIALARTYAAGNGC